MLAPGSPAFPRSARFAGIVDATVPPAAPFAKPPGIVFETPDPVAAIVTESIVHSCSPRAFLDLAATHLRPGELPRVVDNFLARPRAELGARVRERVAQFEAGWRLANLCTVQELIAHGNDAGLRPLPAEEYTPLIRLNRARDPAIALMSPLLRAARLVRYPSSRT
jgi:hypothetical protein